jgi:uncharacterized membrane protein YdjX (TVP38/TMEM64 family)
MGDKRQKVKRIFADKPAEPAQTYSKRYAATLLSVISIVLCILSVLGFVFLKAKFSDTDAVKAWVDAHFLLGLVLMTLVCAVQVIIAFIPGEIVEIAVGYVFGGWLGSAVCIVGSTLGSIVAIMLARKFGSRLVESLYPREKIDALPILNAPRKRNAMTFLLFLIPGTPKDLITYVVGMTEMSIPLYILLTSLARFPSVITSTLGGGALGENKWGHALIIFAIAAVVSGVGYLLYLAIQKKHQRRPRGNASDK